MIWVLVTGSILGYLGIGLVLGGLALNYWRHFEIWDAALVMLLWPLALVFGLGMALVATLEKMGR